MASTDRIHRWATAAAVPTLLAIAIAGCSSSGSTSGAVATAAVAEQPAAEQVAPAIEVAPAVPRPGPIATTAPPGPELTDGADQVQAVFDEYGRALAERDGPAAVAVLTDETFAWYEEVRDQALTAPEAVVLEEVPLLQAITIIRLRAEFSGEELRDLSGEELVSYAVEAGWVGASAGSTGLDRVEAEEPGEAFGVIDGARLFRFVEAGAPEADWEVDLPYTLAETTGLVGEEALIQELSGGEASTREELFTLLATGLGTTWDEVRQPVDG